MNRQKIPPLPVRSRRPGRITLVFLGFGSFGGVIILTIIVLRVFGLIRPFNVPTGGMAPTISPGDHVLMERISYMRRGPRRGDIVVFRTDGIGSLPEDQMFVKRIVGESGEHLNISDKKLFINDAEVSLTNCDGKIFFTLPIQSAARALYTNLTVGADEYFVVGDNTTNSLDSRFYGCIPRANIVGRILFCYWPPSRIGGIK
jgi:signal peptidase I